MKARRKWEGLPEADQNRIRRAEWLAKGICQICGARPHRPGLKSCETCVTRIKAAKKRRREGRPTRMCSKCRVQPARRGGFRCEECLVRQKEYELARTEAQVARRLEQQRTRYRTAKGLPLDAPVHGMRNRRGACTRCTARALSGRDVCERHHATLLELKREARG